MRDWGGEIIKLNKKIKDVKGVAIKLEEQVTKLKEWYIEKEKNIIQEMQDNSFYQSLHRPLNEEELKIKKEIDNFIPEDLRKAIETNNISELLKWSKKSGEEHAKPAIEKLAESEEGQKLLKDTLSDNKWHRRIILNLIKKKGNIDLLKMAIETDNIKLKKEYYIDYLKSLPEIDVLKHCLNKLKEYKKDEDIEPELFTTFLKFIGHNFKYTNIYDIIRLFKQEKIIKKKSFYLKKLVDWNDIPNRYLEFLNNTLKNNTIIQDKNNSKYVLKAIGRITSGTTKTVNLEEGQIIIKDLLNRKKSKFYINYNKIIKYVKPILNNKEENIIEKPDTIKRESIEEIDLLKKILNTTHNDDIKKYCLKGLYKLISNYNDQRATTYSFFSLCLSKHNDIEIRKIAIFALAMNKNKYYIKNLEPLTKDENEEIKIMSTDAIEYIKQGASE